MNRLERLHYFNGQRLDARELAIEQHYHITVRRLLNEGLFTPGVVNGLEVEGVEGEPRKVRVATGLALDPKGRELVLLNSRTVSVPNQPPATLPGYYLTIRYDEQGVSSNGEVCETPDGPGGPGRIREDPVLEWTEEWPNHQRCGERGHWRDCAVVLALVRLDQSCQVAGIETGFRTYAHPRHTSQVHAMALEGEKDIDQGNRKVLHFQVRGGQPNSAVLYLWGDKFSSFHYTEMGRHDHSVSGSLAQTQVDLAHKHQLSGAKTNQADPATHSQGGHGHGPHGHGTHGHNLRVPFSDSQRKLWTEYFVAEFERVGSPWVVESSVDDESVPENNVPDLASHTHPLGGETQQPQPLNAPGHSHAFTGGIGEEGATGSAGQQNESRTGKAHSYLDRLTVRLDGQSITDLILKRPPQDWKTLGNGSAGHPLNKEGTGPIDLTELGVVIEEGPHTLEFSVNEGGGKVIYNLYVS